MPRYYVTGVDEGENEDDLYSDEPYWYQPGHPLDPAEASAIQTAEGFVAERILTVPTEMGSKSRIERRPRTSVEPRAPLECVTSSI